MTLATDEAAFCVVPLIAVLVIGAVGVGVVARGKRR